MTDKISTAGMSCEEWLKMRKSGLGGSDAGAVCGLNPYSSPLSVFHDKTAMELDLKDNESMRQGRDLEEYVARRFMEETGLKVRRSRVMYRSQEHPCMLADVDRLVIGEDAGLECKTASVYSADKWKDGAVPEHYLLQCCHYMAVTGKRYWYLAVVILGKEFRYVKLERDEEMIRNLITIEEDFWNRHIIPGVMPEPDGSKAAEEILKRYFPRAFKERMALPEAFNQKLQRRQEIVELSEKLLKEQEQIEQEIKLFMGEHEAAENASYRVSWSNVDTVRIDSKRLKSEQPEIYQKFSKQSQSRRFSVRAA